jgi:hypothetical protein
LPPVSLKACAALEFVETVFVPVLLLEDVKADPVLAGTDVVEGDVKAGVSVIGVDAEALLVAKKAALALRASALEVLLYGFWKVVRQRLKALVDWMQTSYSALQHHSEE